MRSHPANEPYESRDLELGLVVGSWADEQKGAADIEVRRPLEAPGMDPTWSLQMHGNAFEAVVHLFYGPIVDVTLVRRPSDELYVGGAQDLSDSQLVSMLDDLMAAGIGGTIPAWLRAVADVGGTH